MQSYPFCVLDRAFVVWSRDLKREADQFVTRLDHDLYERIVHLIVERQEGDQFADGVEPSEEDEFTTLARLLWYHGVETLIMLIGAALQAPGAPHAYFLKCRTEDAVALGRLLASGHAPPLHRLSKNPEELKEIVEAIHACASWTDKASTIDAFSLALGRMLSDYTTERNRFEYNSIKHGMRARQGPFALRAGIEHSYGVPPPDEEMKTVGASTESSTFHVVDEFPAKAGDPRDKVNFALREATVAWKLDRVLCELRLISIMLANTCSAIRIQNGAAAGTVKFLRPGEQTWWDFYSSIAGTGITSAEFGIVIDTSTPNRPTADDVKKSYEDNEWAF